MASFRFMTGSFGLFSDDAGSSEFNFSSLFVSIIEGEYETLLIQLIRYLLQYDDFDIGMMSRLRDTEHINSGD